jgi:hypothetical protein
LNSSLSWNRERSEVEDEQGKLVKEDKKKSANQRQDGGSRDEERNEKIVSDVK